MATDPADPEEAEARAHRRGPFSERHLHHSIVTRALRNPSGRSRVASSAWSSRSGEGVRVEGAGVETAGGDGVHGFAHALSIDLRIALVRVDHVETAPVPKLHVDIARSILVVSRHDKPAPLARQFRSEIEQPLLSRLRSRGRRTSLESTP